MKRVIDTFIGIDVAKDTLSIFLKNALGNSSEKSIEIENNRQALVQYEKKLNKKGVLLNQRTAVIFEHTGIYGRVLLEFLSSRKAKVFIESGLRIKRSMGIQRGKTDDVDAKRIAEFGMRYLDSLTCWQPRRPIIQMIKHLLTLRERIKKDMIYFQVTSHETKLFSSRSLHTQMKQLNQPALKGLTKSLAELEKQLSELISKDKLVSHHMKLLTSIPQIGDVTALHFITATNEFKLHTNSKTLACYCGVAPFEHSSGSSIRKKAKINPVSNRKIKSLLHLAALRSITKTGQFKKYYDRKVKEGKHKLAVINAIRNKLVQRIAAVIARDSPYLPDKEYRKWRVRLTQTDF